MAASNALRLKGPDGLWYAQRYQGQAQLTCGPCCQGSPLCGCMYFASHASEPVGCRFNADIGARVAFQVQGVGRDERGWDCNPVRLEYQNHEIDFRGVLRTIPGIPNGCGSQTKEGVLIPGVGYIVGGFVPASLFRDIGAGCCLVLEEGFSFDLHIDGQWQCPATTYSATFGKQDFLDRWINNVGGLWRLDFFSMSSLFGRQPFMYGQTLINYLRTGPLYDQAIPNYGNIGFPQQTCSGHLVQDGGSCEDWVTDWATNVQVSECAVSVSASYDAFRTAFRLGQCRDTRTIHNVTHALTVLDSGECDGDCGGGGGGFDTGDPGDQVDPNIIAIQASQSMDPMRRCTSCGG